MRFTTALAEISSRVGFQQSSGNDWAVETSMSKSFLEDRYGEGTWNSSSLATRLKKTTIQANLLKDRPRLLAAMSSLAGYQRTTPWRFWLDHIRRNLQRILHIATGSQSRNTDRTTHDDPSDNRSRSTVWTYRFCLLVRTPFSVGRCCVDAPNYMEQSRTLYIDLHES